MGMTTRLEVMEQVVTCETCELHEQCTAPVFGTIPEGGTKIAILGEAPGAQEDEQGAPFIGPAGKMLRQHLSAAGIDPATVSFINTVSCFPHGTPTWDHIAACAKNREDQLTLAGATHVLCVGKVATKAIEPALDLKHGRGRPFIKHDRIHFSTYHPAAALRNGNYEEAMADDIREFAELVKGDWLDWVRLTCSACPQDMYWMQESGLTWCLAHVPGEDFEKAQQWRARQVAELEAAREATEDRRAAKEAMVDRNTVAVGANNPATSHKAAAKAFPRSGTKRREVFEIIKASAQNGMTDKELEKQTGWQHESLSATRNSLMKDELIFDSGQRRNTPAGNEAIVWVVEDFV